MGQITIEIPQSIERAYRITNEDFAEQILSELERETRQENQGIDEDKDEILGIWSNRKESAEEIARKLRQGWNRTERDG